MVLPPVEEYRIVDGNHRGIGYCWNYKQVTEPMNPKISQTETWSCLREVH